MRAWTVLYSVGLAIRRVEWICPRHWTCFQDMSKKPAFFDIFLQYVVSRTYDQQLRFRLFHKHVEKLAIDIIELSPFLGPLQDADLLQLLQVSGSSLPVPDPSVFQEFDLAIGLAKNYLYQIFGINFRRLFF